jgi:TolB-like protein
VLPTDVGSDTTHAFLADGLSNDLTTKLSKIPGLSLRA